MRELSCADDSDYRFRSAVGTGGIGTGMFFILEGNRTLGRNESRPCKLLPNRDYCKIHIILHYLSVLLGAGSGSRFRVYPVGSVGDDLAGRSLLLEMEAAGMDTSFVHVEPDKCTMQSVCFQYPDSTGGNISTTNSACSLVTPRQIDDCFSSLDMAGREIMVAAPEVPLPARLALLNWGRRRGAYNAASLLTSEAKEFLQLEMAEATDLLSVNIDEAAALAGSRSGDSPRDTAVACYKKLVAGNPGIALIVTNGPHGCFACIHGMTESVPGLRAKVMSTAGAGDALLAGTLAGIACGLPLIKGRNDEVFAETPLASAVELGTLLASLSVTSPHTIHPEAGARALAIHADAAQARMTVSFARVLGRDRPEN
jgi:sugar/nucleoside kinase (ribokinase family)